MAAKLPELTAGMEIRRVSQLASGGVTVSYRPPAKVKAVSARKSKKVTNFQAALKAAGIELDDEQFAKAVGEL